MKYKIQLIQITEILYVQTNIKSRNTNNWKYKKLKYKTGDSNDTEIQQQKTEIQKTEIQKTEMQKTEMQKNNVTVMIPILCWRRCHLAAMHHQCGKCNNITMQQQTYINTTE